MEEIKELCRLGVGESGRVVSIELEDDMRRRVQCLGLSIGSEVRCYAAAPAGDPKVYVICGATVALRRSDAQKIRIATL